MSVLEISTSDLSITDSLDFDTNADEIVKIFQQASELHLSMFEQMAGSRRDLSTPANPEKVTT